MSGRTSLTDATDTAPAWGCLRVPPLGVDAQVFTRRRARPDRLGPEALRPPPGDRATKQGRPLVKKLIASAVTAVFLAFGAAGVASAAPNPDGWGGAARVEAYSAPPPPVDVNGLRRTPRM